MSDLFPEPIDASTRYCAVYGHPIRHSASPAMQNAGIAALGLRWRYVAFEVRPNNLKAAIAGAMAMNFIGLNLTVPHKLLAVDLVDEMDESARSWKAVNTIRFEGKDASGKWQPLREFTETPRELRSHGFNTDADGLARSLNEDLGFQPKNSKVMVLGAGGAGRTAALKMAADGVKELYLVNRTASKVEDIKQEIQQRFPATKVETGYPTNRIDLVINATSLGLKVDDALPWDEKRFSLGHAEFVYDMIYRPAETPLLKAAQAAGAKAANGIGMLLYQGAKALEIWTGQPSPIDPMRRALEKNVYGV